MTNKELKALRQLLALECSEAAEHIGFVSTRSWQRWEDGTRSVPDDVAIKMLEYASYHNYLIEQQLIKFERTMEPINLRFYMSVDEYEEVNKQRDVIMWKITNAVAAHCFAVEKANLI
ncbi:TPA: DUF1870 family protein [Serratia marcescens]